MPRWVPNAISIVRIALVPLWLWLALSARASVEQGGDFARWPLVLVLLVGGASDALDGMLARRFGLTTNLGATLDALADKLAQVVAVTFLTFLGPPLFTPLPWWLWATLVLRDGLLSFGWLAVWLRHRAVKVVHHWHGKVSSLLSFALIVAATAKLQSVAVSVGAAIVVAIVIPGTLLYLRTGWRQFRAPAPAPGTDARGASASA